MNIIKEIAVFGDSILKGIQVKPGDNRYHVENHIDIDLLSKKYSVSIENYSKFGCTITKGNSMLESRIGRGMDCDTVILEYGGNDCDFDWKAISERPFDEHTPKTPIDIFIETYKQIIARLKEIGVRPILTTLPPIEPQRFFDWFCKGLDQEVILEWLGGINSIYRFQEKYSRAVEKIAIETNSTLVDLRGAFLNHRKIDNLLCEDGTHPNTEGQKIITKAFLDFAEILSKKPSQSLIYGCV